ncbi:MAG: hypothetical protein JNJ54_06425 [Myxococcaceae bacterium]|nr:hypothetical protein [Myxococcaceae bacterium]
MSAPATPAALPALAEAQPLVEGTSPSPGEHSAAQELPEDLVALAEALL